MRTALSLAVVLAMSMPPRPTLAGDPGGTTSAGVGAPPAAATFAAAGETHLERATKTTARPLDEYQSAHTSFDSAYLVDGATVYLCRALAVADLALRTVRFSDDQERLFWEETRRDDLVRLQEDAATTGRPNCRFDATGKPLASIAAALPEAELPSSSSASSSAAGSVWRCCSEVALPPAATAPASAPREGPEPSPATTGVRRTRAQIAVGSTLLISGAGLAVGFASCFAARSPLTARIAALDAQATAAGRDLTDAEMMAAFAADARYRRLSDAGKALGVLAAAGVLAGVLALALPPRASRRVLARATGTGLRFDF